MLNYKARLAEITVKLIQESYTSKCSFLDNERIQKGWSGQVSYLPRTTFNYRLIENRLKKIAPVRFSLRVLNVAI
ncbi:hypothetical protein [Argonema antarcticum]|uniref:hypothetical protein n=1 Tax=Argonema antarcticum TaxID=2942763 RepID=UPI003B84A147